MQSFVETDTDAAEDKMLQNMYRVIIKYCVFFKDFKIFRTLACFPSVSVSVHTLGR